MKKFLIMFVMLLGSVATMQAQSFSFSCVQLSPEAFSPEEVEMLSESSFQSEDLNGARYQIFNTELDIDIILVSNGDGTFTVQDGDGYIDTAFPSLTAAMNYALNMSSINGFSIEQAYPLLYASFAQDEGRFSRMLNGRSISLSYNTEANNGRGFELEVDGVFTYYNYKLTGVRGPAPILSNDASDLINIAATVRDFTAAQIEEAAESSFTGMNDRLSKTYPYAGPYPAVTGRVVIIRNTSGYIVLDNIGSLTPMEFTDFTLALEFAFNASLPVTDNNG